MGAQAPMAPMLPTPLIIMNLIIMNLIIVNLYIVISKYSYVVKYGLYSGTSLLQTFWDPKILASFAVI